MSNSVDKKTVLEICLTFGIILAVLLVIEFVPGIKYHEKTERELTIEKYAELDDPYGYGDYIAENQELYTDQILDAFIFDDDNYDYENDRMDALHFVYDYPVHKNDYQTMAFTDEEINSSEVPALYMSDRRWGYEEMDGVLISNFGCALLSMEMAYLYLTHDASMDPVKMAQLAVDNEYNDTFLGGVLQEHMTEFANSLGLDAVEYNYWNDDVKEGLEDTLKAALDKENTVVLAGMTGETFGGHAIIIRGYDENGYYINDPASREKTGQVWSFDVFQNELVGIWELSA